MTSHPSIESIAGWIISVNINPFGRHYEIPALFFPGAYPWHPLGDGPNPATITDRFQNPNQKQSSSLSRGCQSQCPLKEDDPRGKNWADGPICPQQIQ